MQFQPGLSPQQLGLLEMPFSADEHAFVQGKGVYIRKSAIRRRLDAVDLSWRLTEPTVAALTEQVVVMTASLTIAGVTRGGLGTGVIAVMDQPFKQAAELAKAFKTAASDCLPRAADQFGVGAYLRDLSRDQKASAVSLQRWLADQSSAAPGSPTPPARSSVPPRRSWLDNDGAADAFARRLRNEVHPSLTRELAEKLVKQSLSAYPSSDAALKAVALAHQAAIEDQPA